MSDFQPPGGSDTPDDPWSRPPTPSTPSPPSMATPYETSSYGPSYAAPYGTTRSFHSLSGLSTALTVLFVLGAGAALLAALAFFNRSSVLEDFGVGFDILELSDADDAVRRGSGIMTLVSIVTFVVLVVWQFRHAKNAERLKGKLGLGPGWAIGGWFVPFGSFFLPAAQLAQAAKASDPALGPQHNRSQGRLPLVIVLWAILWGLATIFWAAGNVTRPGDDELVTAFNVQQVIEDFRSADRMTGVGMLFGIAAAATAIVMVRTLTARQQQAIDGASSAPPASYAPPPPPPSGQF